MAEAAKCPSCGRPVDALRAGQVAIIGGRFAYFCDRACKARYFAPSSEVHTAAPPAVAPAPAPVIVEPPKPVAPPPAEPAPAPAPAPAPVPVPVPVPVPAPTEPQSTPNISVRSPAPAGRSTDMSTGPEGTLVNPTPTPTTPTPTPTSTPTPNSTPSPTSTSTSTSTSAQTPTSASAAIDPIVVATVLCFAVAIAALFFRAPVVTAFVASAIVIAAFVAIRLRRDVQRALPFGPIVLFVPPLALFVLHLSARDVASARAAAFAAASAALLLYLLREQTSPLVAQRARLLAVLAGDPIKAGDRIELGEGDVVRADGEVTGGHARIRPHLDAEYTESRERGEVIAAGATVVSGTLTVTATWPSHERGLARALEHEPARIERSSPLLVRLYKPALLGPLVLAACAAGIGLWALGPSGAALVACVALTAVPALVAWSFASGSLARTSSVALAHGIFYRDAQAFDAAGRVDRVALCSGSALTSGKPEVVDVESVSAATTEELLALAAAAEMQSTHAVGRAIVRAARLNEEDASARHPLRTVTHHAGLGVTAQMPSGERLVIGSRMLCMRESVSVASAESRIAGLERKGRIVVLVAQGGRLLGWIALQDELRLGARACVERLVHANVEPVLFTGSARTTAEALAASLGVEHVRPEIAPEDRGAEVRGLATSGAAVAAIGHPRTDDDALGAAGVSVALASAGAPAGEWTITVSTRKPDVAAMAIELARRARDLPRAVILPAVLPGLVVVLGAATGLVPPDLAWLGPLAGAAGGWLSWSKARAEA